MSSLGRARAETLATTLKDAGITAVFATEYKRTQQTASPFAEAAGVKVTTLPGKDTAALVGELRNLKGNTLVVGHSNTIPEIIKALGVPTPVTIGDTEYDNVFVVVLSSPPQLIRLHFR